jgi:nitrite reductase (NADH) small subunit
MVTGERQAVRFAAADTSVMSEFKLGSANNIPPGEGRVYQVEDEKIAVFRTRGGEVYAVQAECPHRGGPLADGLLGGSTLICPLHAWKFDLKTGEALYGDCGLKTFSVSVDASDQIILLR